MIGVASPVVMEPYDAFASFYDAVNGEPDELINRILSYLRSFAPDAQSVLELGCGTGAVLAELGSGLALTGVDRSLPMLDYARRRVPDA
jgi:SAM-dependent methyltransferase